MTEHAKKHSEGAKSLLATIFRREAALVVSAMVMAVAATVYAQNHLVEQLKEKVDAGVAPVERRVGELERAFERHETESARVHLEIKANVAETQADIRALYKAVMTGQKQERLEQPRDGGP